LTVRLARFDDYILTANQPYGTTQQAGYLQPREKAKGTVNFSLLASGRPK